MRFERLFSPISIGGVEIKNRVLMPAIHMMYNMEGFANDKFKEFYYRRAEGGAGLIFVGGCRFDEVGGSPGMMSLETDDFIPGYREFTDGMHKRGARVGVQLYHAGAYAHQIANEGREALAPSAVFSRFTKEMPREATVEELHNITEKWAAAAKRAKAAGFDMVEISASAGYLICQFLSPKTNLRTDCYGGSWENRTRFPVEVMRAVRGAVGEDYPVCIRIAGNDFVPGNCTNEDAVKFACLMEQEGASLINVTGGWHETVIPQLTGDVPRGGFDYLSAAVKRAVSIPVAVSNRINDPATAENLLSVGSADMVSVGRALIADPDWVIKAQQGRETLIRRCLACNQGCLSRTFFAMPAGCIINPEAGYESEPKPEKAVQHKKLLIVGGGPAGCELAVRTAKLGHSVTIWEKSNRLGGQARLAAAVPAKGEFMNLVRYHEAALAECAVEVVLNKIATAEEIAKSDFDAVVIAAGSTPKTIELNVPESVRVCTAEEILEGSVIAGKNVLVIGGGAVGLECAAFMARQGALSPEQAYFMLTQHSESTEKILGLLEGSERSVTVIDIAKVGSGFEQGTAWPLLKELDRLKVARYPFASLIGIEKSGAKIEAVKQKTREEKAKERETGIVAAEELLKLCVPCDTVVLSIGSKPNSELAGELETLGIKTYTIGDASAVGKISDAIAQAAELAGTL